jgi:hypothetical protein
LSIVEDGAVAGWSCRCAAAGNEKPNEKAHKTIIPALFMDVALTIDVEHSANVRLSGRGGQNALIQIKGFRDI